MFTERHGREGRDLLLRLLLDILRCEKGERLGIRKASHLPKNFAPIFVQRLEAIRLSQNDHGALGEPGLAGKSFNPAKMIAPGADKNLAPVFTKAVDLAKA